MAATTSPYVSIVIPAYNEARRLPATLAGWRDFLGGQLYQWEILVVDDGSTDTTAALAEAAGARVLRRAPNQGKGGAVRAGVLAALGEVIAYADADMNVAPFHLDGALHSLAEGAGLVTGRRELSEYAGAEGPIRLLAGGLVQITRRLVVMAEIRDTQCGFKVFRRALGHAIFARARVRSFAFDIEVLFLARKLGARIVEMPVSTTYRAESTFSVRRHLPLFLKDIFQIRWNDLAGRYRR
ncbi:MAG: glycosyltransferase [Chloroflexi bacterium]|nr:glycosyltransferase [Chloroflexota bacterium]